jgi:hypothetical protein
MCVPIANSLLAIDGYENKLSFGIGTRLAILWPQKWRDAFGQDNMAILRMATKTPTAMMASNSRPRSGYDNKVSMRCPAY